MPQEADQPRLPGRRAQAARNDRVILDAAREVFLADPKAPIAAVAERAGVGISALYRRYPGKEDLLRRLCHDGLRRFLAEAEAAAADEDGFAALAGFLERVVGADVHALTVHLAGTFTPTPEMRADGRRSGELAAGLVRRAHESGGLRADVGVGDLELALEGCSAIRTADAGRTAVLRRRHLALLLRGMRADTPWTPLPGPAPEPGEVGGHRWRPPAG